MKSFLFSNIQSHLILDNMLTGAVHKQAALVKRTLGSSSYVASVPAIDFKRIVPDKPPTEPLAMPQVRM